MLKYRFYAIAIITWRFHNRNHYIEVGKRHQTTQIAILITTFFTNRIDFPTIEIPPCNYDQSERCFFHKASTVIRHNLRYPHEKNLNSNRSKTSFVRDIHVNFARLSTLCKCCEPYTLLWRHNGGDGLSNHQLHDCLLNRSFRCRSKKTSKLRVTGLCAGNSPLTVEFPAQMASNAENVIMTI